MTITGLMCNNEHGCLSNGPDGSLPAARVTYDCVFHEPRNAIVTRVIMRGNIRLYFAMFRNSHETGSREQRDVQIYSSVLESQQIDETTALYVIQ